MTTEQLIKRIEFHSERMKTLSFKKMQYENLSDEDFFDGGYFQRWKNLAYQLLAHRAQMLYLFAQTNFGKEKFFNYL